jgi:hypothetical protein
MAKILNLKAPETMELRKMAPEEIDRYVTGLAGEALDNLPEGVKPHRVNAVSLNQTLPQAEWEVWAQWTRACADQASRIEEFTDPVIDEIARAGLPPEERAGKLLKSELRIQEQGGRGQESG